VVRINKTNEKYWVENGFIIIERSFRKSDQVELEFLTEIRVREDLNHEKYFTYGALMYALPIAASGQKGRVHAPGFEDLYYEPVNSTVFEYHDKLQAKYLKGEIWLTLKNAKTKQPEKVRLIPLGKTILRQVTFRQTDF